MIFLTGIRINQLRKEQGITKKALAEELGVSIHMMGKIERSEKTPSYAQIMMLSDKFNVSMEYLYGDSSKR